MVEYNKDDVCKYYYRDGGFCYFQIKTNTDELPPLAAARRKTLQALEPKIYCTSRVNPAGKLTVEAVKRQKECSMSEARGSLKRPRQRRIML
jgi:hypothetical protein